MAEGNTRSGEAVRQWISPGACLLLGGARLAAAYPLGTRRDTGLAAGAVWLLLSPHSPLSADNWIAGPQAKEI